MARGSSKTKAPHYAELAWNLKDNGVSVKSNKGLNVTKIVKAAIALANEDGLDGVTIRQLSKRLGYTTMAVYRHITSREELILLMIDNALGDPPSSIQDASTWQEALMEWGKALYVCYQDHPWALDAPLVTPTTPNHIFWLEVILAALEPSGLNLQKRLDVSLLVDGHARNIANITRQAKPGANFLHQASPATWLPSFIDANTYPFFMRSLQERRLDNSHGPDFVFGLQRIIDGIAAYLK
jgi:AcrR family transcriptional regulator